MELTAQQRRSFEAPAKSQRKTTIEGRWARGNSLATVRASDTSKASRNRDKLDVVDASGRIYAPCARFRSVSGKPGGGSSPLIRIDSKARRFGDLRPSLSVPSTCRSWSTIVVAAPLQRRETSSR
jgi:hypothetical protein